MGYLNLMERASSSALCPLGSSNTGLHLVPFNALQCFELIVLGCSPHAGSFSEEDPLMILAKATLHDSGRSLCITALTPAACKCVGSLHTYLLAVPCLSLTYLRAPCGAVTAVSPRPEPCLLHKRCPICFMVECGPGFGYILNGEVCVPCYHVCLHLPSSRKIWTEESVSRV